MTDPAAGARPGTGAPDSGRLMRLATYASVTVAFVLIAAKFGALLATGSVAILSSLIDSALDALASLINLVAVNHALQPADREHRFGHGKAESLAGLGQAAFVGGSAVFLLIEAMRRLVRPEPVENGAIGIAVIVLAIVLTLALVVFQRYVVKRSGSVAIEADSLHYKSDLLMNASVIVALVLSATFGWTLADPLFALAIAGVIIYSAWQILRRSYDSLMDREFPDELRARIREIALSHPDVLDMHDLRTRQAGTDAFIQFHLELDSDMSLLKAHRISDEVEANIRESFPAAEVIIHQDPEGVDEDRATFG